MQEEAVKFYAVHIYEAWTGKPDEEQLCLCCKQKRSHNDLQIDVQEKAKTINAE